MKRALFKDLQSPCHVDELKDSINSLTAGLCIYNKDANASAEKLEEKGLTTRRGNINRTSSLLVERDGPAMDSTCLTCHSK